MEEKWNFISKLENYYRKAILRNLDKNLWYSFDNIQYKNRLRQFSYLIFFQNWSFRANFLLKKKKSGIKGKQVFQEDRFQSFQTVRLTPDRLGRSNSSNRYRTPPDIARSISIQWTAHAILKRSVALLALSTFYLQLRRNFRVTSVKCPPFLPLCVFR